MIPWRMADMGTHDLVLRFYDPARPGARFFLEALERLAPMKMTGVELEVMRGDRRLIDSATARAFIARLGRTDQRKSARGTVVGEFKRIDFSKRELTIRHNETGRDMTCHYEAHVEETLLAHPRELLLVFGSVTRDAAGKPALMEDVDHIEFIDLAPFSIEKLEAGEALIHAREPLEVRVGFDEDDTVYTGAIEALSVSVFAQTCEMLVAAVEDSLAFLWEHIALAHDDKLIPAARTLKTRINQSLRASGITA